MMAFIKVLVLVFAAFFIGAQATSGSTYIRWGNSTCPSVGGTSLVYAGRAGGSWFTHQAGGNYLCMPDDPEYSLPTIPGFQGRSQVYGAEYESPVTSSKHDFNVPCAVCDVWNRGKVLMIPAKTTCPSYWTTEYTGYLMSSHISHARTEFVCVDKGLQTIPGTEGNRNGALFYHAEVYCTYGLECPPYVQANELTCAVCSQ